MERDPTTFADDALPRLRQAVDDLSWLRGRNYAEGAASTLVGDRYQLTARQRAVVQRAACSDDEREERFLHRQRDVAGRRVAVDGFNQLLSLEHALDGGAVFRGRDGVVRDVIGMNGRWQRRARTGDAILALRAALVAAREVIWFLDAPVGNSGQLATVLRRAGIAHVEVVPDVDAQLLAFDGVVVSSDGPLLSRHPWVPLLDTVLPKGAWVVDLAQRRSTA